MLEIAIKDTDKTPMWSVPGTTIFLSFETPGPLKVDIATLSPAQKRVIAQDIARNVIVGNNTEEIMTSAAINNPTEVAKGGGSLAKSYSTLRVVRDPEEGHLIAQPAPTVQEIKQSFTTDPFEERKNGLKEFLNKHVATVKKDLPGRSLSELRILKDIELQDKKRDSVVKLIDALISKAQAEVFHSIQKSQNNLPLTTPKDLPPRYLDNVGSIVESDHTDVTIKLGPEED